MSTVLQILYWCLCSWGLWSSGGIRGSSAETQV